MFSVLDREAMSGNELTQSADFDESSGKGAFYCQSSQTDG